MFGGFSRGKWVLVEWLQHPIGCVCVCACVWFILCYYLISFFFSSCWSDQWTANHHQFHYTESFDGNQLSLLGHQHPVAMAVHIFDSTSAQFRHIRLASRGCRRHLSIYSITAAISEPFQRKLRTIPKQFQAIIIVNLISISQHADRSTAKSNRHIKVPTSRK